MDIKGFMRKESIKKEKTVLSWLEKEYIPEFKYKVEDIEITNNNPFLIEERIPSLTIEEADYVSTWFNKFNKGDGIYINLQIYYDSQKMILLPYDILKSNTYNIPYVHKNVYSSYDPVNDFLLKAYSKGYVFNINEINMSPARILSILNPLSYSVIIY